MSRPYININSATYDTNTDVFSFDILALRLRGQSEITFGGFTQSKTLSITNGFYSTAESGQSFTFSANIDGSTASGNSITAVYTPATSQFTLSGTSTPSTNIKMTIWGIDPSSPGSTVNFVVFGAGGYTYSSTQSTATAVQTLANEIINSGLLPLNVTATSSGDTITLTSTPDTGAFYNGNPAKIESTSLGAAGFTFSGTYYTQTWSGGVTTLTVPVSTTNFGILDDITIDCI